jgi:hypothetical protein
MSIADLFIYRDPDYPSCWIDEKAGYPDRIGSFMKQKGLHVLKADELREMMIDSIKKGNARDKLVVFSQDVVPDTVAEDYFTNTTFREYLDAGGSVLWIGDIPLFYIGKRNKTLDQAWKKGSPLFMLGIVPVFANAPEQAVTITREGERMGLKHRWSGVRPVLVDSSVKVLAESESVLSVRYIDAPEPRALSWWDKFRSWIKRVKIGVGLPSAEGYVELEFREPPKGEKVGATVFHGTHANAWMVNYNRVYPYSGFYRIWDYGPRHITDDMLEELYSIVKSISN